MSDDSGIGAEASEQPATAAPAAEQTEQPSSRPAEGGELDKAMADIVAQTVKAFGLGLRHIPKVGSARRSVWRPAALWSDVRGASEERN